MADPPRRGLIAVEQARSGRTKFRWPAPKFWAWTGIILLASAILHWKHTQSETESGRQTLLARQRAVAVELEPRWKPLRDQIESATLALANEDAPEVIDHEALANWTFRDQPGLYLRLPIDEAKDVESIRKGAKKSLRDGFTSCLMRVPNIDPYAGIECRRTRDCPAGQSCNEVDHCAPPSQPYNLRVAYRSLYVLSDDWVRDTREADNDLRLMVMTGTFDDAVADDIPVAIDLLTRAKYFMVVLDEPPQGGPAVVEPEADADGGAAMPAISALPHVSRVGLIRIADGKTVLRLRREAGGKLMGGTPADLEQRTMDARQRQANSCALALAVREAIGDDKAAAAPP